MDECVAAVAATDDEGEKVAALGALAVGVVQGLVILADLEIARNGFHRADVVNMTWDELHPTFTGLHDLPVTAKRRWSHELMHPRPLASNSPCRLLAGI